MINVITLMNDFPKIPRDADRRYKLTIEQEDQIFKMRMKEKHTYKFIASKFNVCKDTVYYLCQKRLSPEIYKRRVKQENVAAKKYRQKIPRDKLLKISRNHYKRQIKLKGEALIEYDRNRSLVWYHKNKTNYNKNRNERRRVKK